MTIILDNPLYWRILQVRVVSVTYSEMSLKRFSRVRQVDDRRSLSAINAATASLHNNNSTRCS